LVLRAAGYQEIQGTKPQSLGYGLEDSPAGLAGWIVEKSQEWNHADIRDAFTFDRLLDNITAYWVTGTATSHAHEGLVKTARSAGSSRQFLHRGLPDARHLQSQSRGDERRVAQPAVP